MLNNQLSDHFAGDQLVAHVDERGMAVDEGVALRRVESAQHADQVIGGESRILAHPGDRQREPRVQVLEVGQHRRAVAGAALLGDQGDPDGGVHDRRVEVDHRRQGGHRGGEVDEPDGGVAGRIASAELMPFEALPDQLVVLRVERHQHTLDREITFRGAEQIGLHPQLPASRSPRRRRGPARQRSGVTRTRHALARHPSCRSTCGCDATVNTA